MIIQTKNQNREPITSIKAKFRPSTNENKEEIIIYYQIIQNRVIRQLIWITDSVCTSKGKFYILLMVILFTINSLNGKNILIFVKE